ncbi:MAG TPA: alanine racemase [Terriglobales bacterium]|nr:alanine racemase [Terriglobales bacterium]
MRPTWAEINLSALRHNFRVMSDLVGPQTTVCAVIKADAYGHGIEPVALALQKEGAQWLGVTSTDEGAQIRDAGVQTRILLMTGCWHGEEDEVVARHLTPAVWDGWQIDSLQQAAAKQNTKLPIHLKVDTGMTRFGVNIKDLERRLEQIRQSPNLELEGVFTHLASAEVIDAEDVEQQRANFAGVRETVKRLGFTPRYFHMANTAATLCHPETRDSMVRPGLAMYGYIQRFSWSSGGRGPFFEIDLKRVLSWKTKIISIREVGAGRYVGYNGTFLTTRRTRIAGLPIGYADGLNRKLSNRGRFIVRDKFAPVIGRISMDISLIDVTEIPDAAVGDEVLVIGTSANRTVSAWDHAHLSDTIAYEILCAISERVPRRAVEQ